MIFLSRILAVSDIHGFSKHLQHLLNWAAYAPGKDRLFLLGDYLANNIKESAEALELVYDLVQQGAQALNGNNELRLLNTPQPAAWQRGWLPFLASLPLYYNIEDFLLVHAGIRPGLPLEQQSAADLTEIREPFLNDPFVPDKPVVFGHVPTFQLNCAHGEIYHKNNRIGIDTGAKHGYRLTLVDLTNKLAYSCSTSAAAALKVDWQLTSWT